MGTQAGFSECSGLTSQVKVIEYREGGDSLVRKLPGSKDFGNITLKRGVTNSTELQDWHRSLLEGQIDRRNGSVILLDDEGQPVIRWNFFNALRSNGKAPTSMGEATTWRLKL